MTPELQAAADAIKTAANATPAPAKKERKPRVAKAKDGPQKTKGVGKAKNAKPPHQPSKIKATEQNPAKSIVPVKFKAAYAAHNDTNGSPLSLALKKATTMTNEDGRETLDVKALAAIAKQHGIDMKRYTDANLNNGQLRMNVGNRLRGMVKQGKTVTIGKQTFKSAKQVEAASVAA